MKEGIGVLLLFFNKVDTTGLVLERILEAKPSVLLLAQDGAREGNAHDEKAVPECRKRVEELLAGIDWPCEIYRNYAEKNMSCDPREYSAISWAFGIVDKLIILEDDCLCSSSFFPFMEELLLRYEKDERIGMICGMERFGRNPYCKDSYYFTQTCSGCGWATWKRCWDDVERIAKDYDYLDDTDLIQKVDDYVKKCCLKVYRDYIPKAVKNREDNRATGRIQSWEFAQSAAMIMESRLAINPMVNLVKNIGMVPGATHSGNDIRTIPKRYRRIFENDNLELEFPLRHPVYIIRDIKYEQMHDRTYAINEFQKWKDDIEHIYLYIRYGHLRELFQGVKRRLKRHADK